MNTRPTIPFLAVALSIALSLPQHFSVAAEESGAPFLKVGSFYKISIINEQSPRFVKILAPAGGQWFRVESYFVLSRSDWRLASAEWINFANVVSVTESKGPEEKEPERK